MEKSGQAKVAWDYCLSEALWSGFGGIRLELIPTETNSSRDHSSGAGTGPDWGQIGC